MVKHVRFAMALSCAAIVLFFVLAGDRSHARLLASSQQAQAPSPQTGQSSQR
jgi:hypothetical protein